LKKADPTKIWNQLGGTVYGVDAISGQPKYPPKVRMYFRLKSEGELVQEILKTYREIERAVRLSLK